MTRMIMKTAIAVLFAALTAVALLSHAVTNEPPPPEPTPEPCRCITEHTAAGTVVRAQVLDKVKGTVVDASLHTAGQKESTLAEINIPIPANSLGLTGAITGRLAHAAASAGGGKSDGKAEVTNFNIALQGPVNLAISALVLRSDAHAECTFEESRTSGSSEILGLSTVVDGLLQGNVVVAGKPNQVVQLPGGIKLIINEQTPLPRSGSGVTRPRITVNALRLVVPNIAEVVVSSAHAGLTCFCRPTT